MLTTRSLPPLTPSVMDLNCPACNKSNAHPAGSCVRCGCDLTRLWSVKHAAAWHLECARMAFAARDASQAMFHAHQSWALLQTSPCAQAGALASAVLGDLDALQLWRQRVRGVARSKPC